MEKKAERKAERKVETRNEMQRILTSLDERWVGAASRELCGKLNTLVETKIGQGVDHILAWTKFFPGEADLSSFIVSQLGQREVYFPRSMPDRSMNFISVGKDWHLDVETGLYGIPEPKDSAGDAYDMANAHKTLVIVPGIAFDKLGNRLGRGKGYYDRFLGASEMLGCIKIGVCWTLQIIDKVPISSRDIAMDWICHEDGFFSTSEN